MNTLLELLNDYMWALPLALIQVSLIGLSLWQWNKNRDFLRSRKVFWLFIIIFLNFIGPLLFLLYLQRLGAFGQEIKGLNEYGV